MTVTVRYMAQLRTAAGVAEERVEGGATLSQLLSSLAELHGEALARLLLDGQGNLQPTILVFVGDEQAEAGQDVSLPDGAVVTLLSPIAGGQP